MKPSYLVIKLEHMDLFEDPAKEAEAIDEAICKMLDISTLEGYGIIAVPPGLHAEAEQLIRACEDA